MSSITDFKVTRSGELFVNSRCVGQLGPQTSIPDHSLLAWSIKFTVDYTFILCNESVSSNAATSKRFDFKAIPTYFMLDQETKNNINDIINQLESVQQTQQSLDNVHDKVTRTLLSKMNSFIPYRDVTHGRSRVRARPSAA